MKREVVIRREDGGRTRSDPIAEFWIAGGELHATYQSEAAEDLIAEAVTTTDGTPLTPADGEAFFDALPVALRNSTMLSVRDRDS